MPSDLISTSEVRRQNTEQSHTEDRIPLAEEDGKKEEEYTFTQNVFAEWNCMGGMAVNIIIIISSYSNNLLEDEQ